MARGAALMRLPAAAARAAAQLPLLLAMSAAAAPAATRRMGLQQQHLLGRLKPAYGAQARLLWRWGPERLPLAARCGLQQRRQQLDVQAAVCLTTSMPSVA